ncbi:tetratricopeptide repeat protein [Streptomyces sp. NRRL WC-3742]|uniref:tetratricopeptide repeat protein n=1 Tax=Streptomyces sp. NRRL WC-3742 TaxID=1463934 RepID=UPI0004C78DE9|nr:tetratricopeptide repeat protein [Streptomyces sp. NRRL WC-3742]
MLQHLITQDDHLRMVPTDRVALTAAVGELHEELRKLPEGTDPARARVLTRWIGIGQLSLGYYDEARTVLRQSLDLAAAIGNSRAVVATGLNLGDAHRYAGDMQAADALYRSALDTARNQHPELVDFALQHTGKHLLELGDLAGAQAHLREALRLRTAKDDSELVKSTQDALDRVELLISQARSKAAPGRVVADWSSKWTTWLQSRSSARVPARWAEDFPGLRDAVRALTAHQRVHPRHLRHQRDQSLPDGLIAAMAEEAEKAVASSGYLHNGKWNAAAGEAAEHFAGQIDLASVVARSTGLDVEQPHTAVYIAYTEEGQFLNFHLDELGFGEANLILCLRHEYPSGAPQVSTTVFIAADGYLECGLEAGDCVVFDGALTPHGRTPLGAGERVTLISFGFRARDEALRTPTNLPSTPH